MQTNKINVLVVYQIKYKSNKNNNHLTNNTRKKNLQIQIHIFWRRNQNTLLITYSLIFFNFFTSNFYNPS